MRLWHVDMLPYLPDLQFRGQLREAVAIMHDWRDKGKTNHLLINRVMEYSKSELVSYFLIYVIEYKRRYNKQIKDSIIQEFIDFSDQPVVISRPFKGWHDDSYLRVCMANLYEKHFLGIGRSRITDYEWQVLDNGYKNITNSKYFV